MKEVKGKGGEHVVGRCDYNDRRVRSGERSQQDWRAPRKVGRNYGMQM